MDQLYPGQRNGAVLLTQADGSWRIYEPVSGVTGRWVAPPGAFADTLVLGGVTDPGGLSGQYSRQLLDGTVIWYAPAGLQTWTAARTDTVQYTWRSLSLPRSGLATVRVAPRAANLAYTFAYTAGGAATEVLTGITDPAGRTLGASVQSGRLVSVTDPTVNPSYAGAPAPRSPGASVGGSLVFAYDAFNRVTHAYSRRGTPTIFGYQADTHLLTDASQDSILVWSYTAAEGRGLGSTAGPVAAVDSVSATSVMDPPETGAFTFWINGQGQPARIQDPLNNITTVDYSTDAPLFASRVRQPNGRVVRMQYDGLGRLVSAEDSTHSAVVLLGRDSTVYTYTDPNALDQPSRIIAPRAGAAGRDTTLFTYTAQGLTHTVRDPRGFVTTFGYTNGQLTSVQDALGAISTLTYTAPARNLATFTVPSTMVPAGFTTGFQYDAAGRVREVTRSGLTSSTWFYPNALNWVENVVTHDSAASLVNQSWVRAWRQLDTKYVYDRDGGLIERIDARYPSRSIRSWVRDPVGRVSRMTDEYGEQVQWYYEGRLPSIIVERNGTNTTIAYDALGRDTLRLFNGLLAADTTRTSYDAMGLPLTINSRYGLVTRTWSREGSVLSETQEIKGLQPSRQYQYSYWLSGARRTMTTPTGRAVTYASGPDNLIPSISFTAPNGGVVEGSVSFAYDALGRKSQQTVAGGFTATFARDVNGTLLRATWNSGADGFIADSFDPAGRLTRYSLYSQTQSTPVHLQYDQRDQITREEGRSYVYDEVGNRVREYSASDSVLYTYDMANGRPTDRVTRRFRYGSNGLLLQGRFYTYDHAGWLLMDSTTTGLVWWQVYDNAGRLISHDPSDLMPQYRYDGLGRLIVRQEPDVARALLYYDGVNVQAHGFGEAVAEPGVDQQLAALHAGGAACYFVAAAGRTAGIASQLGGACPSAEADLNGTGALVRSHSFDLERMEETAAPGGELSYFRNRWYDSRTGRFTQEDPIGFAGGDNLYAYAGNNPAGNTDPFGLCPEGDRDSDGLCPGGLTVAQWGDVEQAAARLVRLSEGIPRKPEFGLFILGTSWGEGYADLTLYGGGSTRAVVGTTWGGGDLPTSTPIDAVAFVHTHPYGVLPGGGRIATSLQPSPADAANARIRGIPVFTANRNGMMMVLPDGTIPAKTWPLGGLR